MSCNELQAQLIPGPDFVPCYWKDLEGTTHWREVREGKRKSERFGDSAFTMIDTSHLVISLKDSFNSYLCMCMHVYVSVFTHVCAGTGRVQKVASGPVLLQALWAL